MNHNFIEILAPAGDTEMLRAAVFSGADCVYLGVDGFNARSGADNFTGEALAQAVSFCHSRGCKVYAALNTIVFENQMQLLRQAVVQVAQAGCDAIIVQDLGVAKIVREIAPGLPLHGSTQMSVHSVAGVRQLEKMGFSRVILSRELSRDEILYIAQHRGNMELEVFVHGALCTSVSGQCYFSTFLGGRSANRGSCAGPCRLPFYAADEKTGEGEDRPATEDQCGMSMKDLSILDYLPELAAMGVCCAKIEGRLRGPEYCAAAVDAALKAREGLQYDKAFLKDVFSRSGFTDGWYSGENGPDMFGLRTAQDSRNAKLALPKARELYRRERPRVAVEGRLVLTAQSLRLELSDGEHKVQGSINGPFEASRQDAAPSLEKAVSKMGGTPFYINDLKIESGGLFAPASAVGALRRELLEQLLELRGRPAPIAVNQQVFVSAKGEKSVRAFTSPDLRARFEHAEAVPEGIEHLCSEWILPLFEADKVPENLRSITWLWVPRVMFGTLEQKAAEMAQKVSAMGFKGFEIGNIGHLDFCGGLGLEISAGFGMNVANSQSISYAEDMGCDVITLSPELKLGQMRELANLAGTADLDMVCYGYMPLMVTRACPVKGPGGCAACKGMARMVDRKGESFDFYCRDTVRSIHNPVPLWMGDRLDEIPTRWATLYFTKEPPELAKKVLEDFAGRRPAPGRFTRGLYDKGIQ